MSGGDVRHALADVSRVNEEIKTLVIQCVS
jgi:hypothetical protein